MRYERRHSQVSYDLRQRLQKLIFEPVDKIISEFEGKYRRQVKDLGKMGRFGKRLRSELLVILKERCGLYYRDIIKFEPFRDLRLWSLAKIYERERAKKLKGIKEG